MANSLMRRAAKSLESKNKAIARTREDRKADQIDLLGKGGVALGSLGAAYVDSKWSENDDGVANLEKLGNLPTNIAVGAGLVVASSLGNRRKNRMARAGIGGIGLGMFGAGMYRYAFDKLESLEED